MWQRFANQSIRFNGFWQTWNFLQLVFRSCWKNSASSLRVTRTPHKYIYYIYYIFIPERTQIHESCRLFCWKLFKAVMQLWPRSWFLLSFGCGLSKGAGDDSEDHMDIEFIWAEGSYHLKYSQIYNRKIVQMIRIDIDMSYVLLVFFLVCVFLLATCIILWRNPNGPFAPGLQKASSEWKKCVNVSCRFVCVCAFLFKSNGIFCGFLQKTGR